MQRLSLTTVIVRSALRDVTIRISKNACKYSAFATGERIATPVTSVTGSQ